MAVHFKSAETRNFWFVLALSIAFDAVVVFVVCSAMNIPAPLLWALLLPPGAYLVANLYRLYNFGKRLALFWLFRERDKRVDLLLSDFTRLRFPEPDAYLNSADEYLAGVVQSAKSSAEARLYAGVSLGTLQGFRSHGPRLEGWLTDSVIEQALARYKPAAPKPAQEDEKLRRATETGRRAARAMADDVGHAIQHRFGHLKDGYVEDLRSRVADAMGQENHSPLLTARKDFEFFRQSVNSLESTAPVEVRNDLAEWDDVVDELSGAALLSDLIAQRVSDLIFEIVAAGLEVMSDNADALKAADDMWRSAYPDRANLEPVE